MSRSNPMHHGAPLRPLTRPPAPRPWPFPVTLPAPGHAPDPRPVRPLPPDTSTLPDAPF
jgi:hypothetical protein